MITLKKILVGLYLFLSILSLLPLSGCETEEGGRRYWRHKEWQEGRGHWLGSEEWHERR